MTRQWKGRWEFTSPQKLNDLPLRLAIPVRTDDAERALQLPPSCADTAQDGGSFKHIATLTSKDTACRRV